MAVLLTLNNFVSRLGLKVISTNFLLSRLYSHSGAKFITYEDAFDNFTARLVQKNGERWEIKRLQLMKEKIKHSADISNRSNFLNGYTDKSTNTLVKNAANEDNQAEILSFVRKCIECNKLANESHLMDCLSICSQNAEKDLIQRIILLCEERNPVLLKNNANFHHYLAEAFWIKGNVVRSLELFEDVYRENAYLRRHIRLMLRNLIRNMLTCRSEAALVNVTKFCERLAGDFQDYEPLSNIWQTCFLSEWYCDQCLALELLEKDKVLLDIVSNMIPYVTAVSLYSDRTDPLHRLLEILLNHDLKKQCTGVLLGLLDYHIRRRDIKMCTEILQWSVKYEVTLPSIHHEKFLNLVINGDAQARLKSKVKEKTKCPNFKF